MNKKLILFLLISIFCSGQVFMSSSCRKKEAKHTETTEKEVLYWTCGMHPSVRVSPEEYRKGNTSCPICHMDLIPVHPEESEKKEEEAMPAVKLTEREKSLAGVETQKVAYLPLMKEIVTSGRIAYDPELAIAEEEYISILESYEKVSKSHIRESITRTKRLLEKAEYKLKLLGASETMIKELRNTRKIHKNLILPEKTVWIYADIYEFELGWVKEGQQVNVEAAAYPGKIFTGRIKAIDSVLDPKTRSARVRAKIKNPGLKLKPDMYVKVTINIRAGYTLSIPKDALIDTGLRKVVYVDLGEGEYAGREVEVGTEAIAVVEGRKEKFYSVKKGLSKGELVVTRANFLIDSQSQITGPASATYGGTLGEEGEMPAGHSGHIH